MSEAINSSEAKSRRFRPYPKYKDSGVEWLGDIPAHWEMKPLKALLTRNDSGVWGEGFDDEGVVVLRSTEQTVEGNWNIQDPARRCLSARAAAAARLVCGDLVTTKSSGSQAHIGKTSIVDHEVAAMSCCFSNFMQRLRVAAPHMPRFVWYFMNCPAGREQLIFRSSTTTGLGNLNGAILGSLVISTPLSEEQRDIVAFLDYERAKIDALIEKKERLIELLQEKRTALITQAVTKGLDPNVPMKDSGVDWLGKIPTHWGIVRVKEQFNVINGSTPSSSEPAFWDGDIVWVTPDDLGELDSPELSKSRRNITKEGYRSCGTSLVPKGSLVLSTRAPIGHLAIASVMLCTNQGCKSLVFKSDGNYRYFYYLLRSARPELESLGQGSTFNELAKSKLSSLIIIKPPKAEENAVAAFLDRETAKIDALVAKIQEAIERLKEYRTALISAAVTGKIDLRGEVAQ